MTLGGTNDGKKFLLITAQNVLWRRTRKFRTRIHGDHVRRAVKIKEEKRGDGETESESERKSDRGTIARAATYI